MSIHGLQQQPASYPSNFITLPFTIPSPPYYGAQVFKCAKRSVTSTGGVPTMTAGQSLQDIIFDFGDININLSRVIVTLEFDAAVDYLGDAPFGMVCWDYGPTSSQIIVTTYNNGLADVVDWSVNLMAFPITDATALLSYINDTNLNNRLSIANGPPAAPQPVVKWTFNPPVGSSFNENQLIIGDTGILYAAEDNGNLLAIVDNGNSASLLWAVDTGFTNLISPSIGNGDLLYGVGDNTMKCVSNISTATPSVVWTTNLTSLTNPKSPLIQYDIFGVPTIYVSGLGIIYSVKFDGSINWVYSPAAVDVYLAVSLDGSTIYAAADDTLYALTTAGALKWSLTVGVNSGYPTIGANGTIYLVSDDDYIYAVTDNGGSGILNWTFDTGAAGILNKSLAIGPNGSIYAVNRTITYNSSYIYAISDSGLAAVLEWTDNDLPTIPSALTAVTVGSNGLLYVTGDYGYIACVTDNGNSYTNNYGFQATASGFSSPCSIGINNRIYFGGDHDFIVAL